jgi:hypothetical protein
MIGPSRDHHTRRYKRRDRNPVRTLIPRFLEDYHVSGAFLHNLGEKLCQKIGQRKSIPMNGGRTTTTRRTITCPRRSRNKALMRPTPRSSRLQRRRSTFDQFKALASDTAARWARRHKFPPQAIIPAGLYPATIADSQLTEDPPRQYQLAPVVPITRPSSRNAHLSQGINLNPLN